MKTTKKLFSILAATMLVFSSCKKDVAGPQGEPGKDGNANVISTQAAVTSWTLSGTTYYATVSVPSITQEIVDAGAVLCYMSDGSTGWYSMPYTYYMSGYQVMYYTNYGVGYINIYNKNSNLTTPAYPGTRVFKIVTISSAARLAHPELDWSDYNKVKETFNLKD